MVEIPENQIIRLLASPFFTLLLPGFEDGSND
jgi:hypothetical protein